MGFSDVCIALCMLVGVTQAARPPVNWLPHHARRGKMLESFDLAAASGSTQYRLDVPLDWNNEDSMAFSIRYHIDESYFNYSNPNAPIFVTMGGEANADYVKCSSIAIENNALCVGVEHRFYGASIPTPDQGGASTSNYKAGFSVEQNLADTAAIIDLVQKKYAPADGALRPVINQGGSYSGATCSWFRQAYPDHTMACVSSSGVVNTILDFYAFDDHVTTALQSPEPKDDCDGNLREFTRAVERKIDAGEVDSVKALFNASNLIGTTMGTPDFLYAIADAPQMMDQYGNKAFLCDGFDDLSDEPSDDERITNMANILGSFYGPDMINCCFYDSECIINPTITNTDSMAFNSRAWRWQKCSQVAYLQRAPDSDPLRSTLLTMDVLLDQCDYVFGNGTASALLKENQRFLQTFGGADPRSGKYPNTSNVFYLDFSDDPWVEASVGRQIDETLPYCMTTCDGCGHCGAGVPEDLTECDDKASAFVASILANE